MSFTSLLLTTSADNFEVWGCRFFWSAVTLSLFVRSIPLMRLIKFLHPHPAHFTVYIFDWNNRLSLISPCSLRNALPSHALRKLLSVVMTTGVVARQDGQSSVRVSRLTFNPLGSAMYTVPLKKAYPADNSNFVGIMIWNFPQWSALFYHNFQNKILARLSGEKLQFDSPR